MKFSEVIYWGILGGICEIYMDIYICGSNFEEIILENYFGDFGRS